MEEERKNEVIKMTLEGWKFPTETEAKSMDVLSLREEVSIAEQELDALNDILEEKEEE